MNFVKKRLWLIAACTISLFAYMFKGWSWRIALHPNNLAKLLMLYLVLIATTIFYFFDFSKGFFTKALKGELHQERLAFYSISNRIGENLLYHRFKSYIDTTDIDYMAANWNEASANDSALYRHFYYAASSLINIIFQPRYNLTLAHHVPIVPYGYNILYVNLPMESLADYNKEGKLVWRKGRLDKYDAYADLVTMTNGVNKGLLKMLDQHGVDKPIMPLYIGLNDTTYKRNKPQKALITGSLWGYARGALKNRFALQDLASNGYLVAVGLPESFAMLKENYHGLISDKKGAKYLIDKMIETHQEQGIALIIHTYPHNMSKMPTNRVAEAAMSGALIISDGNGFVQDALGNNALYVDYFTDEDSITRQIKDHINWARSHPEEVAAKTKAAHRIFTEKYNIGPQFEQLRQHLRQYSILQSQ